MGLSDKSPATLDPNESPATVTIEDQLNAVGLGHVQWMVVLSAGLMVLADGMELAAVTLLEHSLKREWGLSSEQLAWPGSILFAGTILGALSGGLCSDKFGRKFTLIWFGVLFIFGGICAVIANSFAVFSASRFVRNPVSPNSASLIPKGHILVAYTVRRQRDRRLESGVLDEWQL